MFNLFERISAGRFPVARSSVRKRSIAADLQGG